MVLHAVHLCSGYGGFELALRLAGVECRTVAHVERDAHAAATLVARMEDAVLDPAPVWSDLTTFVGAPWRGRVDLVTAGFPCPDFSSAGRRQGVHGDQWLWPWVAPVIRDVGPRYVLLENVPGLVRLGGLTRVLSDLADLGFDAEWGLLSASAVGAPHERQRFWLLAYTGSGRCEAERQLAGGARSRLHGDADRCRGVELGHTNGARRTAGGHRWPQTTRTREPDPGRTLVWPPTQDDDDGWNTWIAAGGPEPQVRRSTHGRPLGLADALHLGGNGLVPRVAAEAFAQLATRAGIGEVVTR